MPTYKPVQNESAHLTDKPGRSSFKSKKLHHGKRQQESKAMKKPMKLEKGRENKTRS